MAKQIINIGTLLNDGNGDALRIGAQKINDNFGEIYNVLGNGSELSIVSGLLAGSAIIVSSKSGEVLISAKVASAQSLGVIKVGDGLTIDTDGVLAGQNYVLPIAASNILGGVKVGDGLAINNTGVLSATTLPYSLPIATSNVRGGVKIGAGLVVDAGGVVSSINPTFRVVAVPTTSVGVAGNLAGDVAFSASAVYYCTENFSGDDIWVKTVWSTTGAWN